MHRRPPAVGLLVSLLASVASADAPATRPVAADVEARVRDVARELPWLSVVDAMYDRAPSPIFPDAPRVADVFARLPPVQPMRLVAPPTYTIADVAPLLADRDPRVRTLALVLLARTNRLEALPLIAGRVDDLDASFPRPRDPLLLRADEAARWAKDARDYPLDRRSVGDVAREIVEWSLDRASAADDAALPRQMSGDVAFYRMEVGRFVAARDAESGAWAFRLAMARAGGGRARPAGERADAIYRAAWSLSDVKRLFALLALDVPRTRPDALPDDAADLAARPLAAGVVDRWMSYDRHDPDLPAATLSRHVLRRAGHLLPPTSTLQFASDLRTTFTEPFQSRPGWDEETTLLAAVARARRDPRDPLVPLVAVMRRLSRPDQSDGRARLAAEMAILGGEAGLARAVDWFFAEPPEPRRMPGVRADFLDDVRRRRPERFWPLAARIVRDPRLDALGAQSLRCLIGHAGFAVATDEEWRAAYLLPEADRTFESLARWRAGLRARLAQWSLREPATAPAEVAPAVEPAPE